MYLRLSEAREGASGLLLQSAKTRCMSCDRKLLQYNLLPLVQPPADPPADVPGSMTPCAGVTAKRTAMNAPSDATRGGAATSG